MFWIRITANLWCRIRHRYHHGKIGKAVALGAGLRLLDIVAGPKPPPSRDLRPGWARPIWAWLGWAHG